MANWNAFSVGGIDPLGTYYESWNNRHWNQRALQDSFAYSSALAAQNWDYYKKSLTDGPSMQVAGLEKAGLNPILAANSSAGVFGGASSGPILGDGGHSGSFHADGNPFEWGKSKADKELREKQKDVTEKTVDKLDADIETQGALRDLYKSQAERNRFLPLTETDSGGLSILGSGFNMGGTDTILYDTKNGSVIRPKSANSAASSLPSSPRSSSSAQSSSDKVDISPGLRNALEKRGITLDMLMNRSD